MKVLIAGGAGYIGSTVAWACADAGISPVILDSLVTGRPEFAAGHAFYAGDIADGALIDRIFGDHPDICAVVHCAALIVVPDSVADPVRYYRANVAASLEFVAHLLRNGCPRLIFSSSAAIYRPGDGLTVDEESAIDPQSPYARTKAVCEAMFADIAVSQPLRVLSLRYFNPIGADPKMRTGLQLPRPTHALGKMIQARDEGVPFVITGTDWPTRDGSGLRDYIHVWDLATAHVSALTRFDALPGPVTVINLGTGTGTTVRELLAAFNRVAGRPVEARQAGRRPGDVAGACTRIGRAERLLGWRPQYDITEGIRHSLQWAGLRDEVLSGPGVRRPLRGHIGGQFPAFRTRILESDRIGGLRGTAYDRTVYKRARGPPAAGCGGAEMGQDLDRHVSSVPARQKDPPWPTVAVNTVRLWLERHRSHGPRSLSKRPGRRRQRLILVISAVLAMALGAGVTLAAYDHGNQPAGAPGPGSGAAQDTTALQAAAADRHQAATWIAAQVGSNVIVACDPEMCAELQNTGFPPAQLMELQPSAPDPLGSVLVVATPVIRNQFGIRLATVYAPLVIARFGSGSARVDVRYVAPDGTAAFESQLGADRDQRIAAGRQLLSNQNIHASPAARQALLAGHVDPRLLVTLSALSHQMELELVIFDDPSPGVSSDVPLRGAEVGAVGSAALPAMVTFLDAQRTPFQPAQAQITQGPGGQKVVAVRFDAPGPMGLGGS
ncbi:MAG: UDP-glucose 4-epimerase GalE [Actinobacteria bacterium]|nr:UDP-glucose 4-epimerase GalE [Actinomycetota bacterium]